MWTGVKRIRNIVYVVIKHTLHDSSSIHCIAAVSAAPRQLPAMVCQTEGWLARRIDQFPVEIARCKAGGKVWTGGRK